MKNKQRWKLLVTIQPDNEKSIKAESERTGASFGKIINRRCRKFKRK